MSISPVLLIYRSPRNDAKTVNAISQGVFSKNTKIAVSVLKFFLSPPGQEEDPEDEEDGEKVSKILV
jgi:hypothetical protein